MTDSPTTIASFRDLNLPDSLLKALDAVGYETPTPIQTETIPLLMAGDDLLGNAPTGTGKTAAFALPLISRIDMSRKGVQLLVLAPTRELAIQVAEALQKYAAFMPGFHVLPIYGGQEYSGQIRQLKRGVHAVVGTPGRVMDHMRRGTLVLDSIQALVLDEADEMLRMGFLEDVEWILEKMPTERQTALFSATMPKEVLRIAKRFLRNPKEIAIRSNTATADTIRQRFWMVANAHKLDALTRILEVEPFEAILIFVRTKISTTDLADRLSARGYSAAAINGDMVQKQREQMISRLTRGGLDILVATDVAARGLDVDRISHVINYDIPYDTEAYIHRIGRTGRAGRAGEAILFVAPREQRLLSAIEKATRQKISRLELPTTEMVNNKRISDFKQQITNQLATGDIEFMQNIIEQYQNEHDVPALEIAGALAKLLMGDKPFLAKDEKPKRKERKPEQNERKSEQRERKPEQRERTPEPEAPGRKRKEKDESAPARREPSAQSHFSKPDPGTQRFRLEVGRTHAVEPGMIVGALKEEAGLEPKHIGNIDIRDDHTFVDLPSGMPPAIFRDLKHVVLCDQKLAISKLDGRAPRPRANKKAMKKKMKPREPKK